MDNYGGWIEISSNQVSFYQPIKNVNLYIFFL